MRTKPRECRGLRVQGVQRKVVFDEGGLKSNVCKGILLFSVSLPVSLTLSLCLSVYLALYVCLSLSACVCLHFCVCVCFCLSVYLSLYACGCMRVSMPASLYFY